MVRTTVRANSYQAPPFPPLQLDLICEGPSDAQYLAAVIKQRFPRNVTTNASSTTKSDLGSLVRGAKRVEECPGATARAIWIICDRDLNTDAGFEAAEAWLKKSSKKCRHRLALSNPCLEYWLLLHFDESPSPHQGSRHYLTALQEHVPGYSKSKDSQIPVQFLDSAATDLAAQRADKVLLSANSSPQNNLVCRPNLVWGTPHTTNLQDLFTDLQKYCDRREEWLKTD